MTAASAYPPGPDQGSSAGRVSEPSMEDILASIRRIIADDQQSSGVRRRAQAAIQAAVPAETEAPPAVADRDDVLDLAHFAASEEPSATHHASEIPIVSHHEIAHEHAPLAAAADTADEGTEAELHEGEFHADDAAPDEIVAATASGQAEEQRQLSLLAPPMSESVMSAFEALAATVVLENKPMLEGILRDLLRPMLKTWLDDNLPVLVERLVRVEIERVARGGRA